MSEERASCPSVAYHVGATNGEVYDHEAKPVMVATAAVCAVCYEGVRFAAAALAAAPVSDSLDAAWQRATRALPEGWGLSVAMEREDGQATARAGRIQFAWPPEVVTALGPTPTAALTALAEKLENGR